MKDLPALTLVGPTRNNPVLDPLAVLHLNNHLYISINFKQIFFSYFQFNQFSPFPEFIFLKTQVIVPRRFLKVQENLVDNQCFCDSTNKNSIKMFRPNLMEMWTSFVNSIHLAAVLWEVFLAAKTLFCCICFYIILLS